MIPILGVVLLGAGLFALIGVPHAVGFFWGGIGCIAAGSMLVALSFAVPRNDARLRIEPRFARSAAGSSAGQPDLDTPPAPKAMPTPAAVPRPMRPDRPPRQVDLRAVSSIPIQRRSPRPPTYGWFGPDRTIQLAGDVGELMAAIRAGALRPTTSVHCIDDAGNTGPVTAAGADPLLRALFWAAETGIPDAALPGLLASLNRAEFGQAPAGPDIAVA